MRVGALLLSASCSVGAHRVKVVAGGALGLLLVVLSCEIAGACFERLYLVGEGGDAWSAGVFGHGAGLERAEVAVHRRAGLRELALDRGKLVLLVRVVLGDVLVCLGDRFVDQLPGR